MDEKALNKYMTLKGRIESAEQKANKAAGALEQTLTQLKDKFGCETLTDGRKLCEQKTGQLEKLEARLSSELEKFEGKWDEIRSANAE